MSQDSARMAYHVLMHMVHQKNKQHKSQKVHYKPKAIAKKKKKKKPTSNSRNYKLSQITN
jgi:hypothetical protein